MNPDTPKKQFLQYQVLVTFEVDADDPAAAQRALDGIKELADEAEVRKVRTVKR